MVRFILMIFILFASVKTYSQVIVSADSLCRHGYLDKQHSFRHITVENRTAQVALCWFTKDTIPPDKDPIYCYFMAPKGDFSLYNMITEHGSTLFIENIDRFPKLFDTFYKVIEPFSSFNIYVLADNALGNRGCDSLVQTIFIKDIRQAFNSTLLESLRRLSYKPDGIDLLDPTYLWVVSIQPDDKSP